MKKIEELRNYLLENHVNGYGDLDLGGLDFSDFNGDVCIDNMKVQGNLFQSRHEVQGHLYQSNHEVQGNLYQHSHEVQGNLYQYNHEVKGDLYNKNNKYGGDLYENTSTKLLKEVTAEELAELGYTLKGAQ